MLSKLNSIRTLTAYLEMLISLPKSPFHKLASSCTLLEPQASLLPSAQPLLRPTPPLLGLFPSPTLLPCLLALPLGHW